MKQDFLDLSGKTAVITGASRGIGAATANLFAQAGANLVLLASQESEHLARVKEETSRASRVITSVCHAESIDEIKTTYNLIYKEFGSIDVLVNNAGILEDALVGMIQPEMVRKVFEINTFSQIYHLQYASRLMKRGGSIINVSSIVGRLGNKGQVVYSGSKAALIGVTFSAAKELAERQIRVNAVAPGLIETDMTKSLPQDKFKDLIDSIQMGRAGTPQDVAKLILFLASDFSQYITGQVIGIDGGLLI